MHDFKQFSFEVSNSAPSATQPGYSCPQYSALHATDWNSEDRDNHVICCACINVVMFVFMTLITIFCVIVVFHACPCLCHAGSRVAAEHHLPTTMLRSMTDGHDRLLEVAHRNSLLGSATETQLLTFFSDLHAEADVLHTLGVSTPTAPCVMAADGALSCARAQVLQLCKVCFECMSVFVSLAICRSVMLTELRLHEVQNRYSW